MASSAQTLEYWTKALGFSNGWAELALKKPPPLVPSCLIASWLATGPMDGLLGAFERRRFDRACQRLGHAEATKASATTIEIGSKT